MRFIIVSTQDMNFIIVEREYDYPQVKRGKATVNKGHELDDG